MKLVLCFALAAACFAVDYEIKPLTPEQTATLQRLKKQCDDAEAAKNRAWDAYKASRAKIKQEQHAEEDLKRGCLPSGAELSLSQNLSRSSGVISSSGVIPGLPCWDWDFTKDFRYLVKH